MVRKVLFALAFGTAILPACAGEQTGTITTTSGVLERAPATCIRLEASCERNEDCCTHWCVAEQCEQQEP
jgi:hypothetical protein